MLRNACEADERGMRREVLPSDPLALRSWWGKRATRF
jgi:hypothetical protein